MDWESLPCRWTGRQKAEPEDKSRVGPCKLWCWEFTCLQLSTAELYKNVLYKEMVLKTMGFTFQFEKQAPGKGWCWCRRWCWCRLNSGGMGEGQGESMTSAYLLKVREGRARTPCKKRLPLALGREGGRTWVEGTKEKVVSWGIFTERAWPELVVERLLKSHARDRKINQETEITTLILIYL